MHNPPNLGPKQAPVSEADRNIRRAIPAQFNHARHNQAARIAAESAINQPRVFLATRRYLGVGNAQLEPYSEVILPKPITAGAFLERIEGVEEGDSVELLPEGTFVGYRGRIAKAERAFVYRRSAAATDFTIPAGRLLRVHLKRVKTISLG